jgi:hypothetical protein
LAALKSTHDGTPRNERHRDTTDTRRAGCDRRPSSLPGI